MRIGTSKVEPLIPFAIPFLLHVLLSAFTISNQVYWQDSGFYLSAIKDLALLYPPGFVLYEILCWVWTKILFFADFTLAVHLFSSACASFSAGILGLTVRAILQTRGRLFHVGEVESRLSNWAGVASGCIASCGFTFWLSGLYAKVYAFFFLILVLLIYWMVRTDRTGKAIDFTILSALIGLSWQAHPSAALTGMALIMFVAFHFKSLGWRGIGWRAGVSALCALGPSLVFLPILARRETTVSFGAPATLADLFSYLLGRRFMGIPGAFSMEESRWLSVTRYFWEEMLIVGSLMVGLGLVRLARVNRKLLLGIAAWTIPIIVVSVAFRIEGQNDFWLVAAWIPLHLAAGVGLAFVGRACGRFGTAAAGALAVCGVGSGICWNGRDVNLRGYDLAELYGRIILGTPDPGSILILTSDDSAAIGQYLQKVRGEFPGLLLVRAAHIPPHEVDSPPGWYVSRLRKADPTFRTPDFRSLPPGPVGGPETGPASAAVINANAGRGRGVFVEEPPPQALLRPDLALVPAGVLWKAVRRGEESLDPRHWEFPIQPEEVRRRFRRERSPRRLPQAQGRGEVTVFEPFEKRLFVALLRARLHLADWHFRRRQLGPARALYESIAQADPGTLDLPEVVYPLATSLNGLGEADRALPLLRRCLGLNLAPDMRALAHAQIGEIFLKKGDPREAEAHLRQALLVPGVSPSIREQIEKDLAPPDR